MLHLAMNEVDITVINNIVVDVVDQCERIYMCIFFIELHDILYFYYDFDQISCENAKVLHDDAVYR